MKNIFYRLLKGSLWLALIQLGILGLAHAQQPLSLSDAIQTSLEQNYNIQIEQKQIDIAQRNNNWGEAGAFPNISLSVAQSNSVSNIDNPTSFVAGDIVNTGINPGITVNWTLFNGFAVKIAKERLSRLQEETEGNAAIVVQNTLQSTIQAYYAVALEKERLAVLNKNLKLSRDRYDYVKIKKELGSSVTADLLLAEGNYLTDSTNYINQQLSYRQAFRTLNILMNVEDLDQQYELTDALAFEAPDYAFETLKSKMEQENANLRRQYLSQAVLQSNTDNARAGLYPSIDLRLNGSQNINSQNLSRASFANPGQEAPSVPITAKTLNYGATISITYNLFNGGRIKRSIQNAIVQEEIGQLRIEVLKQSLDRDLRSSLDLYNIRKQLLGIAQRNREVAETNLQIGEERFKNGTINSFDYRTLQNNFLVSSLNELQATYNLIDANAQLLRLTGGIVEEY